MPRDVEDGNREVADPEFIAVFPKPIEIGSVATEVSTQIE